MSKKLTQEEFLERVKEVHGDTYRYDKTVIAGSKIPVIITCPIHGDFTQRPGDHLRGCGCPSCGIEKSRNAKRSTTEEFIEKAKKVHGNKYDYSKVEYIDKLTPVIIICPIHGEFTQTPDTHLNGSGCQKCGMEKSKQTVASQKLTTEIFIERARKIHGDKYNYSKVEYVNSHTPVKIICKTHGEFEQSPTNHLRGKGCPICAGKNMTTEQFIEKARIIHGDKYDYSKVNYINSRTRVCIICPEHGEFWQTPNSHLSGKGCPICAGNKLMTTEEFIIKAKEKHHGTDDLSEIVYKGSNSIITPICPKHGKYKITASSYLSGKRCNECGNEIIHIKKTMSMSEFILKAREVHGYKDTFEKVDLLSRDENNKICITCKEHGDYWITLNSYLQGSRCPVCGEINRANSNRKSFETFKKEVFEKYGDKINVDNSVYVNDKTPLTAVCKTHGEFSTTPSTLLHAIYGCPHCAGCAPLSFEDMVERFRQMHGDKYEYIPQPEGKQGVDHPMEMLCRIHGKFTQTPYHHMTGCGCPKCSSNISKDEVKIHDYIVSLVGEENVVTKDHSILNGKEIDILVPSLKIGFEYDGLYWHSEANGKDKNYHLQKTELAESKGYRLIHIFEDEWVDREEIVKHKIKHLLHCDKQKTIGARKCQIKTISTDDAKLFLNKFHIQGWASSSLYFGAYYNNILVGVMSFLKEADGNWNLTRFATSYEYNLPGLANKLFKYFITNINPTEVKTFLDRRWGWQFSNVYNHMGFVLDKVERPDYYYIHNTKRLHKFNFRKAKLKKIKNFPNNWTETQMAHNLGYYKMWNCGLIKYVWRNSQQN